MRALLGIYGVSLIFGIMAITGEMSEWSKETVLKTVIQISVSWVRIPLSPPVEIILNGRKRRTNKENI